jgi:hypothetical protein
MSVTTMSITQSNHHGNEGAAAVIVSSPATAGKESMDSSEASSIRLYCSKRILRLISERCSVDTTAKASPNARI